MRQLLLLLVVLLLLSAAIELSAAPAPGFSTTRFFLTGVFGRLLLLSANSLLFTEPPPTGTVADALLFLLPVPSDNALLLRAMRAPSTPLLTQFESFRRYSRCFSNTMEVTAWILFLRACCDALLPIIFVYIIIDFLFVMREEEMQWRCTQERERRCERWSPVRIESL